MLIEWFLTASIEESSAIAHQRDPNSLRTLNILLSKGQGPEQANHGSLPRKTVCHDLQAHGPLFSFCKLYCGSFVVTDVQDVDFVFNIN